MLAACSHFPPRQLCSVPRLPPLHRERHPLRRTPVSPGGPTHVSLLPAPLVEPRRGPGSPCPSVRASPAPSLAGHTAVYWKHLSPAHLYVRDVSGGARAAIAPGWHVRLTYSTATFPRGDSETRPTARPVCPVRRRRGPSRTVAKMMVMKGGGGWLPPASTSRGQTEGEARVGRLSGTSGRLALVAPGSQLLGARRVQEPGCSLQG